MNSRTRPSRVLPPLSYGLTALLVPLVACAFMLLSAWLAHPGWERVFRSDAFSKAPAFISFLAASNSLTAG